MISMIMCYSYSTPQCAGRLQGKDHSRAFNTDAAAFMLCFRLPGQSEVGPQRVERAKCCHHPSPLCLVCSHTGTNGDHGADHQKTTQFVLKKPPTVEKNTDHKEQIQQPSVKSECVLEDNLLPNENSVDPIQPEVSPKMCLILEMFAVSRHSPFRMEVFLSSYLEVQVMHPMVSAPASTTLNGLKNVIISCSQRKKKKETMY